MPFENYQNMLNSLMAGNYQGVGANTGGGVTTGANQYYYNPTPNTLTMANYVPTAQSQGTTAFGTPAKLNTMGVTNPWAGYGKPEWYNPTGSYMVTPQGLVPSWAATQNWMPSAWGGKLPAPNQAPGVYTNEMMGLGPQQGILRGLAPTTGMAAYTPPAAGPGPMAGAVDFTTPNLGGGGGGGAPQTPQDPARMGRGVPGGTTAPTGLGTGGSTGGGGSYGGSRPAPGGTPVSQQRYTPGTNATYGMNRGAPSGPSVGGMGVPPSPNRFAPGNLGGWSPAASSGLGPGSAEFYQSGGVGAKAGGPSMQGGGGGWGYNPYGSIAPGTDVMRVDPRTYNPSGIPGAYSADQINANIAQMRQSNPAFGYYNPLASMNPMVLQYLAMLMRGGR